MKIFLKPIVLALFFFAAQGLCYGWQRIPADQASSHLVKRVEPQYPQFAVTAHIQGDVRIAITITETGAVSNPKPISGHPILIQAALGAVREWQYSPFLTDGKPTTVETVVKVGFYMDDSPEQIKKYEQAAQEFEATLERCRLQLKDRQLYEAEMTCKQAITISLALDRHRNLERAEAVGQTGDVLILERKFSEALENYQKELGYTLAVETKGSQLAAAYYHLGNGLSGAGRLEEALADYEKAESLYTQASADIHSEFLKNEYAKRIKSALSDHAALLRSMGQSAPADALEKQAAAITVKTGLKEE
jgi:TonB family protein